MDGNHVDRFLEAALIVKRLILALVLAAMASVGIVMFCTRVMGPDAFEEVRRAPRPIGGQVAVVGRRAGASPIDVGDYYYEVVLEGPREQQKGSRGPIVWESTDVEPGMIEWASPETLRVSVLEGSYDPIWKKRVRTHKRRGLTVVTAWVTKTPETPSTKGIGDR